MNNNGIVDLEYREPIHEELKVPPCDEMGVSVNVDVNIPILLVLIVLITGAIWIGIELFQYFFT